MTSDTCYTVSLSQEVGMDLNWVIF